MKSFVVIACVLVAAVHAQYPPSGWKPQGARLTLPTEYGAPVQQPQQQENVEVEITKENIEFVGQLGETTTVQPDNEYLPPTTTVEYPEEAPEEATANQDPLTVQQLPNRDNSRNFHEQPQQASQQQRFGQLRRGPIRFQQQRFGRIEQQQPEPQAAYGAPPAPTTTPVAEPEQPPTEENLEVEAVEDGEEEVAEPSIAVANSGSYYILSPDNTLQRVTFLTQQTEDDRRANGFSAQLRYAPVEPIREPVYAYNQQGQLVQVFNRKK